MTTPLDEDRIQASLTVAIDSIAVPPGPGLTRGTWVCVTGAVASSPRDSSGREMTRTTNLLRDFSLFAAPGTLSSAVSGSACGRISDISLSDVASGGSVTLGDARFQFAA